MNALLRKELRLVLPSWGIGVFVLFLPTILSFGPFGPKLALLLGTGLVIPFLPSLESFGREFSNGTFSTLLALPVSRARIWWTKILVLGGALLSIYAVFWISVAACVARWPELQRGLDEAALTRANTGIFVFLAFSGGLWTTLVFRQVAAALWMTVLIPAAVFMATAVFLDYYQVAERFHERIVEFVLLAYGVGGFVLAWWAFLRAQDAAWTGGMVSLPRWEFGRSRRLRGSGSRRHRPMAALLGKELRLHSIFFYVGALLLAFDVCALLLARNDDLRQRPFLQMLIAFGWGFWLLLPFVINGVAVAEERKLAVLESQLCLPFGFRRQLVIKLLVSTVLGLVLGTVPSWAFASMVGESEVVLPDFFGRPWEVYSGLLSLGIFNLGIGVVAFYASTLGRSVLQALGLGIAGVALAEIFHTVLARPDWLFGESLWSGNVGFAVGYPVLGIALLSLMARNFSRARITGRDWIRNGSVLACAVLAAFGLTLVTYHRAWELFGTHEPKVGPAGLPAGECALANSWGSFAVVLPGGDLRVVQRTVHPAIKRFWGREENSITWESHSYGTNWVSAIDTFYETVAVRGDGSLWVSQAPRPIKWQPLGVSAPFASLRQVGADTRWRQVVADPHDARGAWLLKSDGSVWIWGVRRREGLTLPLSSTEPTRLGGGTNWVKLLTTSMHVCLVDASGRTFVDEPEWEKIRMRGMGPKTRMELGGGRTLVSYDGQTNAAWQSIAFTGESDLAVRGDGTLWALGPVEWRQLAFDTDWKAVAAVRYSRQGIALTQDGSLWQLSALDRVPVRMARLSAPGSFVAVSGDYEGLFALARDGAIWSWNPHRISSNWIDLAPSREPALVATLFTPDARDGQ